MRDKINFIFFKSVRVFSSAYSKSNFVKVQSESLSCTPTTILMQLSTLSAIVFMLAPSSLDNITSWNGYGSKDDSSRGTTQIEYWFIGSFNVGEVTLFIFKCSIKYYILSFIMLHCGQSWSWHQILLAEAMPKLHFKFIWCQQTLSLHFTICIWLVLLLPCCVMSQIQEHHEIDYRF